MTTKADTIITNSIGNTGTFDIGSSSSTITIGSGQTGGIIEIGDGANRTGRIDIGTGTGNGPIIIGSATHATTIGGTLGVTGGTTFTGGLSTPSPITLTYTTLPTFTANHIGYQIVRTLTTSSGAITSNSPINPSVVNLTMNLPIGVWNLQYGLRFTATGTTTVNALTAFMSIGTVIVINSISLPSSIGFLSLFPSQSITGNNLSVSSSAILPNNIPLTPTPQTVTLSATLAFTTTGSIVVYGNATPSTYLIATRIA
jgi:hypothetical protein